MTFDRCTSPMLLNNTVIPLFFELRGLRRFAHWGKKVDST